MTMFDDIKKREARLAESQALLDRYTWPEPEPLPDALPPVAAFDYNMLPEAFRPWLADISERMQCPPDFAAVGAMVALSSVIGRRIAVKPKRRDDWREVCNLWGGVIGRPGIMKTPALSEALKPLNRLVAEAQAAHAEASRDWAITAAAFAAQRDALKGELKKAYKGKVVDFNKVKAGRCDADELLEQIRELADREAAEAPTERRYMTSDSTVEKLGELLKENPAGILVFRDELTGWLRTLDREAREADRAFYLEAWNGTGAFTVDRIGRGTIHIEAACVSVLGGIQPGPLMDYVAAASREGRGADGLMQRFQLLVYPNDPGSWKNVDRFPDTDAKNAAYAVFTRLADPAALAPLAPSPSAHIRENFLDDEIPVVSFSDAAQEIFDEWRQELETKKLRQGEAEIIEAHLAKYRKLVPALALITHLADNGSGPISDLAMLKAAAWATYLETHARRVYSIAAHPDMPAAHALLARLRDLPDPFTPKQVYDRHWQRLDRDGVTKAIQVLEDYGYLRTEKVDTGGRPSVLVHVNPRVR